MSERDQKRSWADALILAWNPGEEHLERIGLGYLFGFLVPLVGFGPAVAGAPPWWWVPIGLLAVGWFIFWASWTKPRFPTIWESSVDWLVVVLSPFAMLFRASVAWLRGFSDKERPS